MVSVMISKETSCPTGHLGTQATSTTPPENARGPIQWSWSGFWSGDELNMPITLYTFVHFLFGFIAYAWFKWSFFTFAVVHVVHELFENSEWGFAFQAWLGDLIGRLTDSSPWLPYRGDSALNSNFDHLSAGLGFVLAAWMDKWSHWK